MGLLVAQGLRASPLLAAVQRHTSVASSGGLSQFFSLTSDASITASTSEESRPAEATTSGRTAANTIAKFNLSLPYLKDQVVLAKVVSSSKGMVLLDPGYFGFSSVRKATLSLDQLHNPDPQDLATRTSRNDVRPGDVLKFRAVSLFSPYGEMHLEPLKTGGDVQGRMVWEELREAMVEQRKVKARVLNACQGGYAVGVAGYVGLLPFQRSTVDVVRKIGVLQDFYVVKMDDAQKVIILADTKSNWDAQMEGAGRLYSNI